MKFTFLIDKNVWYKEWNDKLIAKGDIWDFFFVNDKEEVERLKNLTQIWYPVFSYEEVSEAEANKEMEKIKEAEKIEAERDIHKEYEEKFWKEVPRNKKNDEEWIISKLQEVVTSE